MDGSKYVVIAAKSIGCLKSIETVTGSINVTEIPAAKIVGNESSSFIPVLDLNPVIATPKFLAEIPILRLVLLNYRI